jgi:hypothetical protein
MSDLESPRRLGVDEGFQEFTMPFMRRAAIDHFSI